MKRPNGTNALAPRREIRIREAAFVLQMTVRGVEAHTDAIRFPDGEPGVFFSGGWRQVAVGALESYLASQRAKEQPSEDAVDVGASAADNGALTPEVVLAAIVRRQAKVPAFKSRNALPPPLEAIVLRGYGDDLKAVSELW